MRKEISFLVVAAIIALGIIIVYYWGGQPTGFDILEWPEYENQTACESAGYVWENITEQNCTIVTTCVNETSDCEPCLEYEDINGTQGDCITWSSCIEEVCTDEETCVEVVTGGQCIGNICDENNLDLCLNETNCIGAGGYWYDAVCNVEEEPSCSNDLTLCSETNCIGVGGGYWYDDACNEYECETNSQCTSDYECILGSCVEIEPDENLTVEPEPPLLETQEQLQVLVASISADNIENIKLNPGASSEILWNVRNNGGIFLSSCVFEASGDYAEWISFGGEELTDIGVGNTANFDFIVNVSEEIEEGEYILNVAVKCSQTPTPVSKQFVLEVEIKKLEFDLVAADRTRPDRVRIIYSLGELTGAPQDVELKFVLIGLEGEEIAFIEENRSLKANSFKEFKTNMPINESLEGELELVINYNSEVYSSSIREPIVLGAPIGGFAIFEEIGRGEIAIILIVLVSLIVVLFVVKKIRSSGKTLKSLFKRKKEE